MKKNMLTIVVIALCFINLVLSAVMVFTVIPTANKTNEMISLVMGMIELEKQPQGGSTENQVPIENLEVVNYTTVLTINLKSVEGQKKDPFAVMDGFTVYLNKKEDGYSSLKANIESYEDTISEVITNTFAVYTRDEVQNNRDLIKQEVLKNLQERFGNMVIADVSFKNLRLQ